MKSPQGQLKELRKRKQLLKGRDASGKYIQEQRRRLSELLPLGSLCIANREKQALISSKIESKESYPESNCPLTLRRTWYSLPVCKLYNPPFKFVPLTRAMRRNCEL